MQMVVTDQYMQKMEKELTGIRQSVVRIETAMQKFLSQSTDMAKNAWTEKENGKKDETNSGSLATALGKLREDGDRIGEQLGKAADHAISKIGDAFAGFLKNGKLNFSDVARTLKTDLGSMASTQVRSLLATGLTKWLGLEASGTGSAARVGSGTEKNGRPEPVAEAVSGNFFGALAQDILKFLENGKTVFGDLIEYLGTIPVAGGVVRGIGNVASEAGGLFSGLGKSIGRFFGAGGASSGENSMQVAGSAGSDAAEGMQQVAEAGKQSAGDMAKAMQDAMLRTQNVLIRFVETGKLSFRDLTRSILADIAQIMLKMTVSKLFGSIFGGASVSAAGGYDVPAGENPVTQLHEKEMVLPAQYADVIRGLAGNGGTAGSGDIHIHTSISVSGDGSISQQKDGGNSSQRQLADMINNQTKAVIAREMRQGGLIWNMRTGMA